ncbi:hypothetical protein PHJA_001398600 [Phtheirospermum japonicum]|uniref:RING-CH-type domain-containing protein n=1 Tax=Phtheirospermum japonicum TaxID=374723 RepID=A0A830C849_9LAMI|nr:hypothetical protein PHJA_001398600 [Phtheirospermum japonicum]
MRNGGSATMVGESPDGDVEKQERGELDGGGGGGSAAGAAVGQSDDLVEKTIGVVVVVDCPNKGEPQLGRSSASHEECRVCQDENEEVLINLGCLCRGGLAKAHQSCIIRWQIASNVAPPDSQASLTSYWVWRLDPALRAQEHERRCFSPLWVAFSILIGGLLLDVLISITLGVSALPINIIIGVIVVLGLGTALRLALEFCQEWNLRRVVQRVEASGSIGYHHAL